MRRLFYLALAAVMSLVVISSAAADVVAFDHGTLVSDSVAFLKITESSVTDSGTALYGEPTLVGNSLVFQPTPDYFAHSKGGGVDTTDGRLTMQIMSMNDVPLNTLRIEEGGAYTLAGAGTDATNVMVGATVYLTILEVSGSDAPEELLRPLEKQMTVSPSSSFDLAANAGAAVSWTASLLVDLAQELADAGIAGNVTKLQLAMDNALTATSELGSEAMIDKKSFNGPIVSVPEPAAFSMAGMALIALVTLGWRRAGKR